MNKVVLMGRLTRDPVVRYTQGEKPVAMTRYILAIDKRQRTNDTAADFIPCLALGKNGEFTEKYFRQGMKVTISGRIQTGSYTNNEGKRVSTFEILVEEQEFAESKKDNTAAGQMPQEQTGADGFMNIPEGLDEEMPFN